MTRAQKAQNAATESLYLNLGRLQDELILTGRRRRQLELFDPPAVMLEDALIGRLARHVADHPNRGRVKTHRHVHRFSLLFLHDGLQDEVFVKSGLALPMNVTDRRSDL